MKNNKTILFVDGTNLYASQYKFFGPKKYLNFTYFIDKVQSELKIYFDKILFYASYTPQKKSNSRFTRNEFLFYKQVKKTPKLKFFKGYRSKTSGKEKEVDVKLSVDLVGYGLLDQYDRAYLMSGDADFLQAVLFVKKYHSEKDIKLLCMANKIMYKGLYAMDSIIIDFEGNPLIKDNTILSKNKLIYIKKTAELCPRLG